MMSRAIGIDLGTTNSVAAYKAARVEVVTAEGNSPPDRKLTRSVVAWQGGRLRVGEEAYNQLKAEPENVVVSVKRLMGRGILDPKVEEHRKRFGCRLSKPSSGTDNAVAIWLGDREYQPEDISAEILKQVAENARRYLEAAGLGDGPVREAVITVPAYFNDKQRHATQMAAHRAGLVARELLPEPTAAAISYSFEAGTGGDVKTFLVYDFGGGTFDASLITASGDRFIEQGKAGDLWLGGDDIDAAIVGFVKEQVARQEGLPDIDALISRMPHYQRLRFAGDLKIAAERAKIELGRSMSARIMPATPLLDELGLAIDIDVELTRERFEAMISSQVDRSIEICRQAIQDVGFDTDMIDLVLLVGGSSQIPLVERKMREAFGDRVALHPRPMYAVAEGAAIVAANLVDKVGTVSRNYYIRLQDDPRHVLIARNEPLPVHTSHSFRTVSDGQRLVCLELFNEDWVSDTEEPIGTVWIGLDKHYPSGTEVQVFLDLDESANHLAVTAALKNDPSVKVSRSFTRGHADEFVFKELQATIARANEGQILTPEGAMLFQERALPVIRHGNRVLDERTGEQRPDQIELARKALLELQDMISEVRRDAVVYALEIEIALNVLPFLIPEAQQKRLKRIQDDLQEAIDRRDESRMEALSESAAREIDSLPGPAFLCLMTAAAMRRAHRIAPADAAILEATLGRILTALERGDAPEAQRLWDGIAAKVSEILDRELPTGAIESRLGKGSAR